MQAWHLLFEGKETTIKTKLVFSQGMHKHMLQNILEGISGKACSFHVVLDRKTYIRRRKAEVWN